MIVSSSEINLHGMEKTRYYPLFWGINAKTEALKKKRLYQARTIDTVSTDFHEKNTKRRIL